MIPYRILSYLLYAPTESLEWLSIDSDSKVRVTTGPAARDLRIKIQALWEALYWLRDQDLVVEVQKDRKRGTAIIHLKQPTNIKVPN
jgi:hypothetical protein